MQNYTLYFYTNCTDPARELEFNDWYDCIHIPDLGAAKGLTSARRFINLDPESKAKYMAVYDFASENIKESLQDFYQLVRKSFETGRHIDCIDPNVALRIGISWRGRESRGNASSPFVLPHFHSTSAGVCHEVGSVGPHAG